MPEGRLSDVATLVMTFRHDSLHSFPFQVYMYTKGDEPVLYGYYLNILGGTFDHMHTQIYMYMGYHISTPLLHNGILILSENCR